ncbi:MAG: cytochrome D1 domain-containing protein, partial [Anaerohalosphaeraceae bacterium]
MNTQVNLSKNILSAGLGCLVIAVITVIWMAAGRAYSIDEAQPSVNSLSIEGLPLGKDYPYRSPLDITLSTKDNLAYSAQHTGQCVDIISLKSKEIVHSIPLDGAPSGLALDDMQNRLYVTYGLNPGNIAIIDTQSINIVFTLPAGSAPIAPVISADGKTLYICNRFDNEVVVYDLKTQKVRSRISVAREPIAAARTPDNTLLIVAHHLPAQAADKDHVAAAIDLIDTASLKIAASIRLP